MKLTVQAPYAIAAIRSWFVVGAVVNLLTGNPQTGFLVASIAAFDFEVLAAIK